MDSGEKPCQYLNYVNNFCFALVYLGKLLQDLF